MSSVLAGQFPQKSRDDLNENEESESECPVGPEEEAQEEAQSNPDILVFSPEESTSQFPKIPILYGSLIHT